MNTNICRDFQICISVPLKTNLKKWLAPTAFDLILEFSKNEKLQKYKIILPEHANYLRK